MAVFQKFNATSEALARGTHNLGTATLRVALSNTAPNVATAALLADITQIAAGNGYTSGGLPVANTALSRAGGVTSIVGDDVVFTATGPMGPARYAILYNDTAANDPLLGFWDRGSSVTLGEADTLTVDFTTSIVTVS